MYYKRNSANCKLLYEKKVGLIILRITPDSPRSANTPATLKINPFHLLNHSALTPPIVIITPANTIIRKETINTVVVTICISPPIKVGKAFI